MTTSQRGADTRVTDALTTPCRDEGNASLLASAGILALALLVVVPFSPLVEGTFQTTVRCFAERTLIAFESSGGSVCGEQVAKTRLADVPVRAEQAPDATDEDAPADPDLTVREDSATGPAPGTDAAPAPRPGGLGVREDGSGGGEVLDAAGVSGQRWTVNGMPAGDQLVPGLGARKRALLAAGATVEDIAVAMLEDERMLADYLFGDGKEGLSGNRGIFKQNVDMLTTSSGGTPPADDWASLNTDLAADIEALQRSREFYGDLWVAGHRNGAQGLANPNTEDIENYDAAVTFIADRLSTEPGALTSDTRYWVVVPAI